MITKEAQPRSTEAHLRQFDEALANLEAMARPDERSRLEQLQIDAVRAQADDLRVELDAYRRHRRTAHPDRPGGHEAPEPP